MTKNIPRDKWKKFFDEISKRRNEWMVLIEVINDKFGDQILDQGLPLAGITADERGDTTVIEISVGDTADQHQTHSVINPEVVAYLSKDGDAGGTVEIVEKDGTKTLIHIVGPMPLVIDYAKNKEIAAS